eukprot:TRINITY_DN22990_c0_g1_i1.p1 TRINITY_DN22990_c0_g1~~TRINITY_DN22990_c0_g1_i1.p1  ORF type:complete len:329 (+),score=51.62 TRINITY_DN22990_c0_g1_i1:34-987(+)
MPGLTPVPTTPLPTSVATIHFMKNPVSVNTLSRQLQTSIIYLTIALLRALRHLPQTLTQASHTILAETLYNNEVKAAIPYESMKVVVSEAAVEVLQSLQRQLARYEDGPLMVSKKLQQGMVEGDTAGGDRLLDEQALRVTVDVVLMVQLVLQAPEYKSVRAVVLNKDEGPVQGRKRKTSGLGSPNKRAKTDSEVDQVEGAAKNFGCSAFFRVAEVAASLVVLADHADERSQSKKAATREAIEDACKHTLTTLHTLLPHCADIQMFSHLLFGPISLIHDHVTSPAWTRVLTPPPNSKRSPISEIVRHLGELRKTLLFR